MCNAVYNLLVMVILKNNVNVYSQHFIKSELAYVRRLKTFLRHSYPTNVIFNKEQYKKVI